MSGDYLTKLRQKPKHVRDNIAFGVAGGFTSIVALFLVFAVHGPKVIDGVAHTDDSPQLFETLVNQSKEQVAAAKASLKRQKEAEPASAGNPTPAASGSGTPAPAVLTASSSIETASTSTRTVLIATTSASTATD